MFGTKILIDAGEVAAAMGWTRPWFRRRLKGLIEDHAFPSPLPNGRWHAEAVTDWLRRYGEQATAARQQQATVTRSVNHEALNLMRIYGKAA